MSLDTPSKRKNDSPAEAKIKKPRISVGKKDKHSKPRNSDNHSKSHKSKDVAHRRSSDLPTTDSPDSDDDAGPVSPYRRMFPTLHMAIPPVFAADPAAAVAELFDTMLLQYVPELEGVLVTHQASSKSLQRPSGRIEADGAFGLVPARVGCLVWSPRIGMKLEGKIILSSPSHVSLLLDGLFNASITSRHIDQSQWEFVHDEADAAEQDEEHGEGEEEMQHAGQDDEGDEPQSLGHWRNKNDFSRLGGADGKLVFTVVSMTVAKHMLTLHGSLLKRPFSIPPPDDQEQSAEALLPPMEGEAREMNVSQKIIFDRKMRLFEQRRERQKAQKEAASPAKSQNKRVRWHDDESDSEATPAGPAPSIPPAVSSAASKRSGAIAESSQGTKITFDE